MRKSKAEFLHNRHAQASHLNICVCFYWQRTSYSSRLMSAFGGKAGHRAEVPPLCATNGTAYGANPNALVNAGELFRWVD